MPLMDQRLMDVAAQRIAGPCALLLFVLQRVPGLAGCFLFP